MPATIVSPAAAEHYTWGGPNGTDCDAWYLVRTPGLHVIEEQMPPHAGETPHRHVFARQFFFVLAGELTLNVEHTLLHLYPGEGVEVAPGELHQATNRSSTAVRFLVTSQPPSHGDRIDH